jgi:hypothetical protein
MSEENLSEENEMAAEIASSGRPGKNIDCL